MSGFLSELRERQTEVETLGDALSGVAAGSGRSVVIVGPAGIGKTSLVRVARAVAQGAAFRTLFARGTELEGDFSYGVVRQLFEPEVFGGGGDADFQGAAALARPLFDPEQLTTSPDGDGETRFRIRHGLYWLLANMARESPVALIVDDLHWADTPSVDFLRYVSARIDQHPVALVLASRPSPTVDAFCVESTTTVLRPKPLSTDAVSLWVRDEIGMAADTEFEAACHRATQGNPFLVRELLRELKAEGAAPGTVSAQRLRNVSPRGIATSVLLRLAALSREAADLARAIAVLGEARLATAAALAQLDIDRAAGAASELVRADVLAASDVLRFEHPIVRTVLYEDQAPAARAVTHVRAARELARSGADHERVAAHLVLGHQVSEEWAVSTLCAAGRQAAARGAPEAAVKYLTRALEQGAAPGARFDLLLALGRAKVLAGHADADERLREALETAVTSEQYAKAAIKLARVLRYGGAGGEAVTLLERAAERLDEAQASIADEIERELLAASTVSVEARRRLRHRADTWWERATQPAATSFDPLVRAAYGVELANRGQSLPEVVRLARAALSTRSSGGHLGRHVGLLCVYSFILTDRFGDVSALLDRLADAAARAGGAELLAAIVAQRSFLESRLGDVGAAEAQASEALELAAGLDPPPDYLLTAVASRHWAAIERGTEVAGPAAEVRGHRDSMFNRHLEHMKASLAIAAGRTEEGVEQMLALGEREIEIGWPGPSQFPWRSEAALALRALGEGSEARRLAGEELRRARDFGAPRAYGIALRAWALVADPEDRSLALRRAVDVLEGSGATLEHARALIDLGTAVRHDRHPTAARPMLRQGHELAARCGADRLVEHAYRELLAAGVRARRTASHGPGSLTASEHRVAGLAAQELSNREIAQALFVTEKTVETHLSHVYSKLGLRSRKELSAALTSAAE